MLKRRPPAVGTVEARQEAELVAAGELSDALLVEHVRHGERASYGELVRRYASDTLDYFALRDDKQRFVYESTVVAYTVHNGTAVVSPDPVGPADEQTPRPEDRSPQTHASCRCASRAGHPRASRHIRRGQAGGPGDWLPHRVEGGRRWRRQGPAHGGRPFTPRSCVPPGDERGGRRVRQRCRLPGTRHRAPAPRGGPDPGRSARQLRLAGRA